MSKGKIFLRFLGIWSINQLNPKMEAFMAKTIALFFVLGLMVSCASYHNERGISSVHDDEEEYFHVERGNYSGRGHH